MKSTKAFLIARCQTFQRVSRQRLGVPAAADGGGAGARGGGSLRRRRGKLGVKRRGQPENNMDTHLGLEIHQQVSSRTTEAPQAGPLSTLPHWDPTSTTEEEQPPSAALAGG